MKPKLHDICSYNYTDEGNTHFGVAIVTKVILEPVYEIILQDLFTSDDLTSDTFYLKEPFNCKGVSNFTIHNNALDEVRQAFPEQFI